MLCWSPFSAAKTALTHPGVDARRPPRSCTVVSVNSILLSPVHSAAGASMDRTCLSSTSHRLDGDLGNLKVKINSLNLVCSLNHSWTIICLLIEHIFLLLLSLFRSLLLLLLLALSGIFFVFSFCLYLLFVGTKCSARTTHLAHLTPRPPHCVWTSGLNLTTLTSTRAFFSLLAMSSLGEKENSGLCFLCHFEAGQMLTVVFSVPGTKLW